MKHAAVLAGLGRLGKSTLLLNRAYGNRSRSGVVLLNLPLEADPTAEEVCLPGCRLCVDGCPAGAIEDGTVVQSRCRARAYITNARVLRYGLPHVPGRVPGAVREGRMIRKARGADAEMGAILARLWGSARVALNGVVYDLLTACDALICEDEKGLMGFLHYDARGDEESGRCSRWTARGRARARGAR